jgi:hypothetical protein
MKFSATIPMSLTRNINWFTYSSAISILLMIFFSSFVYKSGRHSNKYIQGAYSFHSIRSTDDDAEQLRASYAPDGYD